MTESGVIDKTALVFGQMNEPPGARLRVGLSALTMAEYLEMMKGEMYYCLLTIFLDLLKLDQKFQLFSKNAISCRLPANIIHRNG